MYAIRARRKTVTEKDFLDAVNKVIKGYQKFSATPKYMVYNWVILSSSFPQTILERTIFIFPRENWRTCNSLCETTVWMHPCFSLPLNPKSRTIVLIVNASFSLLGEKRSSSCHLYEEIYLLGNLIVVVRWNCCLLWKIKTMDRISVVQIKIIRWSHIHF